MANYYTFDAKITIHADSADEAEELLTDALSFEEMSIAHTKLTDSYVTGEDESQACSQ